MDVRIACRAATTPPPSRVCVVVWWSSLWWLLVVVVVAGGGVGACTEMLVLPVIEELALSVAVTVCVPAVLRVTVNTCDPASPPVKV